MSEETQDTIPEEIISELKRITRKTRKPEAEVNELFYEILYSDEIEYIHDSFKVRCEYALEQVKKFIYSTRSIKGSSVIVKLDFQVQYATDNSPSTVKHIWDYDEADLKKVEEQERIGYVSGVFQTARDAVGGSPVLGAYFGILTLRGEACKLLDDLKQGCTYRMELYTKVRSSFLELTAYKYVKPEQVNITLPSPRDVILKAFQPISVSQVHEYIGYNRLIHGRVTSHKVWTSKKGKLTGKTEIFPVNSVSLNDKNFTIMWYNSPELANVCKVGSECFFLVHIESSVNNGITGLGLAVIPILAVEYDIPDLFADDLEDRT